jgi:gliding motility-associated-like protein
VKVISNPAGNATTHPQLFAAPTASNPIEVAHDTMICRGESSVIWASGGESYLWSTGENLASISVNPGLTTIYGVTITDATGSQTTASVEVKVAVCQDLYVPNAFTPDGDNLNDEFIVKGENIQSFKMVIFARNGQMVFESNDIQKGWDGKVRGNMGEPGSYTYKINFSDSQGKSHEKKGQLLLLR